MSCEMKRESWSFWALLALLLWSAIQIIISSYWREGVGPGVSEIPKPETSSATFWLAVLYTTQVVIAVCAVFQRRIRLFPMLIGTLVTFPSVFLYKFLSGSLGPSAPAVQIDEFGRLIVGTLAGILLLAPWVFKRLAWPRKSPGHLAIGVSVAAVVSLQLVFHFALVIPGSEVSFQQAERLKALIERTETGGELNRLIELGAVSAQKLSDGEEVQALLSMGVNNPEDIWRSVEALHDEHPGAFHVWHAAGDGSIDRNLMIYDGRPGGSGAMVVTTSEFLLPRLTAISAYYLLAAFSGSVWTAAALFVHSGHNRARRN